MSSYRCFMYMHRNTKEIFSYLSQKMHNYMVKQDIFNLQVSFNLKLTFQESF